MPKVSIIVPIYNVENYLARCLDSVLKQSYENFEVICVNDGSPDSSEAILLEYAKKDKRINIITQENLGLSMARNNGLKKATGEYIYFLDSDDAMHPQLLKIAVNMAKKHNAELVNFTLEKSDGIKYEPKTINESKVKYKITNNPLLFSSEKSKYRITFNVWTKLYKKTLLENLDFIPNIHFEDYPHTYAIMSRKPKTVLTNAPLVFYTNNMESISNQKASIKQIYDYHAGINFIYDIYNKPEFKQELQILIKYFIPNILKQQLVKCQRADEQMRPKMFKAFANELVNLDGKGLISWRGHKLKRYFIYKKLMKGAQK